MMIASIPAAAPTPPIPNAVGAVPREGAAPFDETFTASLGEPVDAPVPGAATRQFADPLALAEWLLAGLPGHGAVPALPATAASEDAASEPAGNADPAAEGEGGDWWEIPADALVVAPASMPVPVAIDAPRVPAGVGHETVEPGRIEAQTSSADRMMMAAPIAASAAAAEPAARQSSNIQPAPSAASQQATRAEVPAEPQFLPTPVAASSTQASAASAGVQQATAQPIVDTAAAADGAQENEATPVARIPTRFERQPATEVVKPAPVAVQAEPASEVAAQHTSEVAVHLRSEATSHHPGAGELYRQSGLESQRVGAAGFAPTVETGTDGQSSSEQGSEQDARRTFAGQRLAAALSMQAPAAAAETAAGAAPTFTVPAASAPAAVAPVAAAVPVTPAAPAQTPDAENVAKLVEAMRVTTRAGGWEAVVRLKPEHFGEVTIQLKVDGNSVSATVNAESAGVRQWLAAQEESVRSGMAEHGLQLDRFAVSRDGQRREAEEQQHEQHRQPRRRTPQRAAGEPEPRFEVVV